MTRVNHPAMSDASPTPHGRRPALPTGRRSLAGRSSCTLSVCTSPQSWSWAVKPARPSRVEARDRDRQRERGQIPTVLDRIDRLPRDPRASPSADCDRSTGGAIGAALVGVLAIVVCGLGLWLIFRSEATAHWVGRLADRLLNPLFRLLHKPPSDRAERWVLHFRTETIKVVGRRGWVLTGTVVTSQLAVLVMLLFSAREVGISSVQVSFLEVLPCLRGGAARRSDPNYPRRAGYGRRRSDRDAHRVRSLLQRRVGRRHGVAGSHVLPHRSSSAR